MLVIKDKMKFIKGILIIIIALSLVIGILWGLIALLITLFTRLMNNELSDRKTKCCR